MYYNLNEYIKMMKKEGYGQWRIGWESLPRYIDHKIYNTRTKKVGMVKWDDFPCIIDENGNEIQFTANEFRHGNGEWIYKIGEDYEII